MQCTPVKQEMMNTTVLLLPINFQDAVEMLCFSFQAQHPAVLQTSLDHFRILMFLLTDSGTATSLLNFLKIV